MFNSELDTNDEHIDTNGKLRAYFWGEAGRPCTIRYGNECKEKEMAEKFLEFASQGGLGAEFYYSDGIDFLAFGGEYAYNTMY